MVLSHLQVGAEEIRVRLRANCAWWVFPLAGLSWVALGVHIAAPTAWALCLPSNTHVVSWVKPGPPETAITVLAMWLLMVMAMMLPMAVPLVRYVGMRSFTFRRGRAMGLCVGGLAGVWLVAGLLIAPALARLTASFPPALLGPAGFTAAALWQFAPTRRRALRRCHRIRPLAAEGWAADRDCLLLGVARGGDCLLSCGAMMLASTVTGHALSVMLVLATIAQAERWARDPASGPMAVVLGGLGVLQLLPT